MLRAREGSGAVLRQTLAPGAAAGATVRLQLRWPLKGLSVTHAACITLRGVRGGGITSSEDMKESRSPGPTGSHGFHCRGD